MKTNQNALLVSAATMEPSLPRFLVSVACILGMALTITTGRADMILAPGATWTVTGGNSNLTVGSSYSAPFGTPNYSYSTYWAPGVFYGPESYLYLRAYVDLTGYDLATVRYSIAIDNDYQLSVNGSAYGPRIFHDNAASWSPLTGLPGLVAGTNQIDVEAIDRGGATFFDFQIQGERAVPDSGSVLALTGSALLGLAALRRRLTQR